MATKTEDWSVTDVARKPAGYAAKTKDGDVQLELISFKMSHQGGAPEQLTDIPFSCRTRTEELARWCAEDAVDARGCLRGHDQEPPIIGGNERRWQHERGLKSGVCP